MYICYNINRGIKMIDKKKKPKQEDLLNPEVLERQEKDIDKAMLMQVAEKLQSSTDVQAMGQNICGHANVSHYRMEFQCNSCDCPQYMKQKFKS